MEARRGTGIGGGGAPLPPGDKGGWGGPGTAGRWGVRRRLQKGEAPHRRPGMPPGPRNPSSSRLGKEHELPARPPQPHQAQSLFPARTLTSQLFAFFFFFSCPLSYPHPRPPASSSQNSLPLDSRKWLVQLCNQIPLNPFVYCVCPSAPPRCPSRLGLGQVTENSGSAGGGPGTVPRSQSLREQSPPTASRQPSQTGRALQT